MVKSVLVKLIICVILSIVLSNSLCVPSAYALGDIFSTGKGFLELGDDIDSKINKEALKDTSDTIYNTFLSFGVVVAVIVAMVLGIQFMVASADEKAKVKEALIPFIVGCIVVFGAFTIWKIVVNIGNRAEDSIKGSTQNTTTQNTTTQNTTTQIANGWLEWR